MSPQTLSAYVESSPVPEDTHCRSAPFSLPSEVLPPALPDEDTLPEFHPHPSSALCRNDSGSHFALLFETAELRTLLPAT